REVMRRTRGFKSLLAITAAAVSVLGGAAGAQAATSPAPTPFKITSTADVKSATWPELHSGDCQQDGGTITVYSNGTGYWGATSAVGPPGVRRSGGRGRRTGGRGPPAPRGRPGGYARAGSPRASRPSGATGTAVRRSPGCPAGRRAAAAPRTRVP